MIGATRHTPSPWEDPKRIALIGRLAAGDDLDRLAQALLFPAED